MSKAKLTIDEIKSDLQRYLPEPSEGNEINLERDFELDDLLLLINGIKRHKIHGLAISKELVINKGPIINKESNEIEKLYDIFLTERYNLEKTKGQKEFLKEIKERYNTTRFSRSKANKSIKRKHPNIISGSRNKSNPERMFRLTSALKAYIKNEEINTVYNNTLDKLIEQAINDTTTKIKINELPMQTPKNFRIKEMLVINHSKESLEQERREFLLYKREAESKRETFFKNRSRMKHKYKSPLKTTKKLREYLTDYNITSVRNKEINEAQIIITIFYKMIKNKKLSSKRFLTFRELSESDSPRKRLLRIRNISQFLERKKIKFVYSNEVKALFHVYFKELLGHTLTNTEHKIYTRVMKRGSQKPPIERELPKSRLEKVISLRKLLRIYNITIINYKEGNEAQSILIFLHKILKNQRLTVGDFHFFNKLIINSTPRGKIAYFAQWFKQNEIRYVFNQESQSIFQIFDIFINNKELTIDNEKLILRVKRRNDILLKKIGNLNVKVPTFPFSKEFYRILKSEVVTYFRLLAQYDKNYQRQLRAGFIDYFPSPHDSESKNEEDLEDKIKVSSYPNSQEKCSRVQFYNDLETKKLFEDNTLLKFDFNQKSLHQEKNLPHTVIKDQLIDYYEDQLNLYFKGNERAKKFIIRYLKNEQDAGIISFICKSKEFLIKYLKIEPKMFFLYYLLETIKLQLNKFKKEKAIVLLTQNRKTFEFQLRKDDLEEWIIESFIDILEEIEIKYISIKNGYYSDLLESQNNHQEMVKAKRLEDKALDNFQKELEQADKDYFNGFDREGEIVTHIPPMNRQARNIIKDFLNRNVAINYNSEVPELIHINHNKIKITRIRVI